MRCFTTPYFPHIKFLLAVTVLIAILAVVAGCNRDAQRIREINESLATPAADRTPLSAEITTEEVQDGDCINSTLPEGISIETVVIVPCAGNWQYRVLNSFDVADTDRYPGEGFLEQRAYESCDRRYSNFLHPTAESWSFGDRTVNCLQDSFELSVVDPDKLDRLVDASSLSTGECYNEAPETDYLSVELVDCSGEWEFRVLNSFDVADADSYPGEGFFDQRANESCDRQYSYFQFPSAESWRVGDRTVYCLQDSFGLSVIDPVPTATPTPTSVPTPSPTSASTATPQHLTPAQIFANVSPAVAYIETTSSSGTALLVNGGYLVTNSHIVWPNDSVQASFPDGTVIQNVPLVGWDMLTDLAVLGPVNVSAQPLILTESPAPAIGAEVLTVGYPGSPGDPPQPVLSRGIVSRFLEWSETELTYIQSDANIEGGQSGGVLLSDTGDVIGMTSYSLGEANYGLSIASSDLAPRIRSLIAGNDPSGIGVRLVPSTGGGIRHRGTLGTIWDTRGYVIEEPVGTNVDITVTSEDDIAFSVYDSFGEETLYVDDAYSGPETGGASIQYQEPHFLVVSQLTEAPVSFILETSHPLIPVPDPDDGVRLNVGQSVSGNIDYPGDIDTFTVRLTADQKVEFSVSSSLLDTFLVADFHGCS